jgi:hypothetical protein
MGYWLHTPSALRNVAKPLGALTPDPVKTTTLSRNLRVVVFIMGKSPSGLWL